MVAWAHGPGTTAARCRTRGSLPRTHRRRARDAPSRAPRSQQELHRTTAAYGILRRLARQPCQSPIGDPQRPVARLPADRSHAARKPGAMNEEYPGLRSVLADLLRPQVHGRTIVLTGSAAASPRMAGFLEAAGAAHVLSVCI